MSLVYEGFTFTGKCGDCGKEVVSQDPEPLIAWMQAHYAKCPFWRDLLDNQDNI
jgi:hypothetical protein